MTVGATGAATWTPEARLTRYSPGAPVLLVTDYPADTAGGGAVILRSLLEGPARARVVWASPSRPSDPALEGAGNVAFLRRGSAGRLSWWFIGASKGCQAVRWRSVSRDGVTVLREFPQSGVGDDQHVGLKLVAVQVRHRFV